MQKGIKNIKWNWKKIITVLIVVVVIAAVAAGVFTVYKGRAAKSASASAQRTTQVVNGNIAISLSGSGTVTSANTSDLMSNVQGKITKAYFKEGDKVKKGDLLYEIDDTDARLNIQKIENSISQAQLNVDSTQKSYSNLTVTAPFDGKITEIAAKAGDTVNNGMTLFTITETSKLTLTIPFGTTEISGIKIGQKALVQVQEFYDTVEGTVTAIDDNTYTASDGGMVRDVEVTVNNPGRLTDSNTANVIISASDGEKESNGTSKFEYANKQLVKAQANGIFSSINIKENQYVKKGDVLLTIDNDDLQVTSQSNDLKVQDLENQLAAAQKQLEDYRIYSPIDGTITGDVAVVGDSVKSGDTLIGIRDFDQMQFTISVDELDIAKVKVGQKATITVDALTETTAKPLNGEVVYKAMEGTSTNGVATYDVTIQINETENLLAGMNANATIILNDAQNVLMLPLEAVSKLGGRSFVRVIGKGDSNGQMPFGNRDNAPGASGDSGTGSGGNASASGSENGNSQGNRGNWQNDQNGQNAQSEQNGAAASSARQQMSAAFTQNQEYYANTVMKEVELGINNDEYVEIKSGLSEGDVVVLPPLVTNSSSGSNSQQASFGLGGGFGGTMPAGGMPSGGMTRQFTGGGTTGGTNRSTGSNAGGGNNR